MCNAFFRWIGFLVLLKMTIAKSNLHIVYSTSCGQDKRQLLSYSLQLSAMSVGQQGSMTEILSGCSDEERQEIENEPSFYHTFTRHFTPAYSPHPIPGIDDDYTPYNKPFGLRHFLLDDSASEEDAIIVLMDADFILFHPIEVNTGKDLLPYYKGYRKERIDDTVKNGIGLAQDWTIYMKSGWLHPSSKLRPILCEGKPCMNVTEEEATEFYTSTGPPYILTKHDALLIADDYCAFVVEGRKHVDKEEWMPEMYAFGVAIANHGIKQTKVTHLGVTHPVNSLSEHWSFVDASSPNPCESPFDPTIPLDVPVGVHYCYPYGLLSPPEPSWHFTKYHLPHDILDCQSMLLKPHPPTQWNLISTLEENQMEKRHEVWVECTLVKIINQVLLKVKSKTCQDGFNSHRGISLDKDQFLDTGIP